MKWDIEDKLILAGWLMVCSGLCGLLYIGFFN